MRSNRTKTQHGDAAPRGLVQGGNIALDGFRDIDDLQLDARLLQDLNARAEQIVWRADGKHDAAARALAPFRRHVQNVERGLVHREIDQLLDAPAHRLFHVLGRDIGRLDLQKLVLAEAQAGGDSVAVDAVLLAQARKGVCFAALPAEGFAQRDFGPPAYTGLNMSQINNVAPA
ncbi:MAG: hypothetical protein DPW12_08585, partial [Rhodocyclaceae bacterium]|nr:hypothetical protein [Rhodocyclaceae bacterium]